MTDTLVDSNVLIDVWTVGSPWAEWSTSAMAKAREEGELVINQIINAEVCVPFESLKAFESAMAPLFFKREGLPWEAAFATAKAFEKYRASGGSRHSPLPDFYIGAHALTRDEGRYRTYFPTLDIVAPDSHP